MLIKLLIFILISLFWRLGGWGKEDGNPVAWKGWRIIFIPILLGIAMGLTFNWIVGLFIMASFQIIRIGYGAYDPEHDSKPSFLAKITHDREGWINRGIAGFLYGLIGMIPIIVFLFFKHSLNGYYLQVWLGYAVANMSLGAILSGIKTKDFIIEPVIGAGIATLIFLF